MDDRYVALYVVGRELPVYIKIEEEKSMIPNGQFKVRPSTRACGTVYTVLKDDVGSYTVSWTGDSGEYKQVTYTADTVAALLKYGNWVIVEETPAQEVRSSAGEHRDDDVLVCERADDAAGSFFIGGWPVIDASLLSEGTIDTTPPEPDVSLKDVQDFCEDTKSLVIIGSTGDFAVRTTEGYLYAADRKALTATMQAVYATSILRNRRP